MAKNSPDQFFQQGSQIKFKLASDSKDLPNIQNHLKETPGGCIKRKKSGSNQDHALERELRFLKLLWLPQACYLRCPPSTSTAGLACTCLQRPDLPVLLSKTMMGHPHVLVSPALLHLRPWPKHPSCLSVPQLLPLEYGR
ncbi:uncharacterized protein LOC144244696 isoform X2 [Crocuta crocuta]